MTTRSRRTRATVLGLLALLLTLLILPATLLRAEPTGPQAAVARAWELAQASGRYRARSAIEQTTAPGPSLSAAGRKPRVDRLVVESTANSAAGRLDLTMRDAADTAGTGAISVRIIDGQVEQRQGLGAWQPADSALLSSVGPGGNTLSFLQGARNLEALGTVAGPLDTPLAGKIVLPSSDATYSHYRFTLDGPALAAAIQDHLDATVRSQQKVPTGVEVDTTAAYRTLSGQGELWIDSLGLPRRLTLQLVYPPQGQAGRSTATITSDFLDFDHSRLGVATTGLAQNPLGWLSYRASQHAAGLRELATALALIVAALMLAPLWARTWGSRPAHTLTVGAVVVAILAAPLLRAGQVSAFAATQQTAQAAQTAQQTEQSNLAAGQTRLAEINAWDAHQDPRTAKPKQAAPRAAEVARTRAATTTVTAVDTDGDGLSDADEATWGSCPSATAGTNTDCTGVANSTDSDADGLTDGIEVNQLGTLPNEADSDGDAINDLLETTGFTLGGTAWYLNPNLRDTNSDGLTDNLECTVWDSTSTTYDATAVCTDLDSDGTPDVFDLDNDGDGVSNSADNSPNSLIAQTFGQDTPLSLTLNGLTLNKPVYVDFQIRPTEASHLNYSGTVLDWPSGDTKGQIQRHLSTTFADTANLDLRTSDDNAANGEVRIVPVLEITMPYSAGSYSSLPVTSAYSGTARSLSVPATTWLDDDALDLYSVTVAEASSGSLTAYLPLTLATDDTTDAAAVFSARMLYRPTVGSNGLAAWGSAQSVKLAWLVEMITDTCTDDTDLTTCTDELNIIQTYYDDWKLAGLTVSEERGTSAAVVYEDPARDTDLTSDSDLWAAAWNMNSSFIRARDCDTLSATGVCSSNGTRDVTISNLATSITSWAGGSANTDLTVKTYSGTDYDAIASQIAYTETTALLGSVFSSYKSQTNPTLLYATERTSRSYSVDSVAVTGAAVTLDLANVSTSVEATMNWSSYQYATASASWENYDSTDYLTELQATLADDSFFQAADSSDDSIAEAEGKLLWAQGFYTALLAGTSATVMLGSSVLWADNGDEQLYKSSWPSGTFTGVGYTGSAYAYTLLYFYQSYQGFSARVAAGSGFVQGQEFNVWKALRGAYREAFSEYTIGFLRASESKVAMALHGLVALTTVGLLVGGITYLVGYFSGDATVTKVGVYILNAMTVVAVGQYATNLIYVLYKAYTVTSAVTKAAMLTKLTKFAAVGKLGLALGIAVPWILFVAFNASDIFAGKWTNSLQTQMAYTVGATLIVVVMFMIEFMVITFFPPAAPFVALAFMMLAVWDAAVTLAGKDEWAVTTWINEQLSKLLFDVDSVINNLGSSGRLDVHINRLLTDTSDGLIASNTMSYTVDVTNTLTYGAAYGTTKAKKTVFTYTLDTSAVDRHSSLSAGQMSASWQTIGSTKLRNISHPALSAPISLRNIGTGINRAVPLYLNESFLVPYAGCWFHIKSSDCTFEYQGAYNALEVSDTFDILPDTIEEFVELGWNKHGALALPAQQDQDGDTLISAAFGGADPSDLLADTDSDGLSDSYELAQGTTATLADTDNDGLSDAREADFSTDPTLADTDNDGLSDGTEAATGWLTSYSGGVTRVWSDPLVADEDGDGLNDLQEFTYGFNPWVSTDAYSHRQPASLRQHGGRRDLSAGAAAALRGGRRRQQLRRQRRVEHDHGLRDEHERLPDRRRQWPLRQRAALRRRE